MQNFVAKDDHPTSSLLACFPRFPLPVQSGHSPVTQLPPCFGWEKMKEGRKWATVGNLRALRTRENLLLTRRLPLFQIAGSGNEFIEKKRKTIRRDFINERDLPCERKRLTPSFILVPNALSSLPFSKLLTSPESPHPINCFVGPSEIRKKGIVTLVSRAKLQALFVMLIFLLHHTLTKFRITQITHICLDIKAKKSACAPGRYCMMRNGRGGNIQVTAKKDHGENFSTLYPT